MPPTEKTSSEQLPLTGRLASLDGWRALSIVMVLASHSPVMGGFPPTWAVLLGQVVDGNLGVRFFFLISGFLITWLMIRENEKHGAVNLRLFYLRRALRILPVCYAYLLILGALALTTEYWQDWRVWLSNLTFTTNFILDRNWHGVPWPTIHLWSLAIEEQFYLVWPPLFVLFRLSLRLRLAVALVAVAFAVAPVARFVSHYELYPKAWFWVFSPASFLNYFDTIALGCLCALLVASHQSFARRLLCEHRFIVAALCLAMIVAPQILRICKVYQMLVIPLGPNMQAVGFAGLLVQSLFLPSWHPYRVLNWPLVRGVGVLSFSLYIWQQLFCASPAAFGWPSDAWQMRFPMGWVLAGCAALLSYLLIERPVLTLRARLRPAS